MIPFVEQVYAADNTAVLFKVLNPIVNHIIFPLIQLVFAIAVVVFAYGALEIVFKGDDVETRDKAKRSMVYGIIGMFIMLSAWGIISFISNTVKTLQ